MKDLPKVFENKIDKNINNNKDYSMSKNKEIKTNDINIYQKINNIFSSYKYVYKADVIITTNDGEFNKIIIGKKDNNLLTIDNELINIDTIKNIELKKDL